MDDWRRWLRHKLVWLLALKLAGLVAIKALFFSGEFRPEITPAAVGARIMTQAGAPVPEDPND